MHSKKNESCVTQANTGYLEKAKFILARIDPRIDSFWNVFYLATSADSRQSSRKNK